MNNLTLDDLYLRYVRAGNADSGDYAAALNWAMDFWVNQGSKQPLTVTLLNRVYNCEQTINVVDGRCLDLRGSGGFMTGPTVTGFPDFATVTRFDGPTLAFASGVPDADAYLRVRDSVDQVGDEAPGSTLSIFGVAIQGQTDWATTTDQTIGLEASGPLTVRNCHISRVPFDGIHAKGTKSAFVGTVPDFYGSSDRLVLDQVVLSDIGKSGWFAGPSANGCEISKVYVTNWGANSNNATGTAAAGTSNAAAIRDDSSGTNAYHSCFVGSDDNGHWKYVASGNQSNVVFSACLQANPGASAVLFSNICLGGTISHTTPPVTIQAATGFDGDAHGQLAKTNVLNAHQLLAGLQFDPTNENLAMGDRTFRTSGLTLNNKNILIDSNDGGEYEIAARREDIPAHGDASPGNNPVFGLLRVYTAGIGQPAYRVVYRDDRGGERTVWSGESTGTHASVGDGSGKPYFEWYYEDGEVVPVGRIMGRGTGVGAERFQYQHLELGAGDSDEVDVFLGRSGPGEGYLGWTADVSLGINPEAKWRSGVFEAINSLGTPKVDCATQLIQQGTREIYQQNITNATSPYTVTNSREVYTVDASGGNVVINLPASAGIGGRIYQFFRTDGSGNSATITPNGAELIQGSATKTLDNANHSVKLFNTGAGWVILSESGVPVVGGVSDPLVLNELQMQAEGSASFAGAIDKRIQAAPSAGYSNRGALWPDGKGRLKSTGTLPTSGRSDRALTVGLWIYLPPGATTAPGKTIMGLSTPSSPVTNRVFQLLVHGSVPGRLTPYFWAANGLTIHVPAFPPGADLPLSAWSHVVIRYDLDIGTVDIFVNGTKFTGSGTTLPQVNNVGQPTVDLGGLLTTDFVAGAALDDVGVVFGTLSDAQCVDLYGGGVPPDLGALGYYDLYWNFENFATNSTVQCNDPTLDLSTTATPVEVTVAVPGGGATSHVVAVDTVTAVNTSAGNITCNLPACASTPVREFDIYKSTGDANVVVITPDGSDLINGQPTLTLTYQYDTVRIINTGGGWVVLNERRQRDTAAMARDGKDVVIGTPGTFETAADASWYVPSPGLRGFSLTNGVLTKTSPTTRRYRITATASAKVSAVDTTRFSYRINGAGDVFNSFGQTYFPNTGVPLPVATRPYETDLAQGDTVELILTHFSAATVTLDFVTLTIEEI